MDMYMVAEKIRQKYNFIINEAVYQKTSSWLLVSNPGSLFVILVSYYYFCTWFGPLWMRDRKPYQLMKTLLVYNACQVLMSLYLVYCGTIFVLSGDYNMLCAPVDYSDTPSTDWIAACAWWFFIAKLTELLDTVFFVLRKKTKQISTLHIYHHTTMPIITWIGVKYIPGGHATLTALLNSFVHVIMYGYYLVSGLGPEYQQYLWWKRHLTSLQLIQFVIIALHNVYPLFTDCNYPKWFNVMSIINAIDFVYMFADVGWPLLIDIPEVSPLLFFLCSNILPLHIHIFIAFQILFLSALNIFLNKFALRDLCLACFAKPRN